MTFLFLSLIIIILPIILNYKSFPQRSIYIYLILWVTFPKTIRYLPFIGTFDLSGFNYFDVLQTIFSFHILILLLIKGYKSNYNFNMPIKLKRYTMYFTLLLFLTLITGTIRYFILVPESEKMLFGNLIENVFNPFSGLILFIGLFAFINDFKKIEKIIYIFVFAGILLLLEHFIIAEFNLLPALNVWAYASDKVRFNSLIYSSYDIKAIFCVLSALSLLYISISKKKYYLLILVLLMILPISSTFQRTAYLGYIITLISFFLIYIKSLRLKIKLFLLTFSFIIISLSFNSDDINSFISGDGNVRKNELFETQSFYDRLGLWYRSFDIFINYFPFGIGEGMFEVYSVGSLTPEISKPLVLSKSFNSYKSITGFHSTKPHNVYIQFISEYNIFGLLILSLFIKQLFIYLNNYTITINREFKALVYSMVIGVGIMSLFDSVLRLYFLYGLLMFFAYFINKSRMILKI